ncbi:MAG: hypothetical protein KC442_22485, partial [Thermomicrobiales bacterium]|nr:hypothetical protein [Thermomicrobiales bacterium]
MDNPTFDRIARRLASHPTRRRALSLVGGLLTISLRGPATDARKKGKKNKPCPPCKKRKKGKCKKHLPDGAVCVGGTCLGGACVPGSTEAPSATTTAAPCPLGQTRCGSACVDLAYDANHCGACGRSCGAADCYNGVCTCEGTGAPCPGDCHCVRSEGPWVCTSPNATAEGCPSSNYCPLGTVCLDLL